MGLLLQFLYHFRLHCYCYAVSDTLRGFHLVHIELLAFLVLKKGCDSLSDYVKAILTLSGARGFKLA